MAARLFSHFTTDLNRNAAGGTDMQIPCYNRNTSGIDTPLPIDWDIAVDTAAIILLDDTLARDASWTRYVQNLMSEATSRGPGGRVFPVVTESGGLDVCQDVQAFRWDEWTGDDHERGQELIRYLTRDFIRMLRYRLEADRPDAAGRPEDGGRHVNIFISHSANDVYGKRVAEAIRDWVNNSSQMSSFLASRDIQAGKRFGDVIDNSIRDSVVVVYTDSYSSREWCRHEVIEAKRANVPMLMVDCLESMDERSFPYMGNMPVVRMDPMSVEDIPTVVGRLLDEAFRHALWQCGVASLFGSSQHTTFMAWPPELVSVAVLPGADGGERSIVYPDPSMSPEELGLFSGVDCNLRLLSLSQWRMEAQS